MESTLDVELEDMEVTRSLDENGPITYITEMQICPILVTIISSIIAALFSLFFMAFSLPAEVITELHTKDDIQAKGYKFSFAGASFLNRHLRIFLRFAPVMESHIAELSYSIQEFRESQLVSFNKDLSKTIEICKSPKTLDLFESPIIASDEYVITIDPSKMPVMDDFSILVQTVDKARTVLEIFVRWSICLLSVFVLLRFILNKLSFKGAIFQTKLIQALLICLVFSSNPLFVLSCFVSSGNFEMFGKLSSILSVGSVLFVFSAELADGRRLLYGIDFFFVLCVVVCLLLNYCKFALTVIGAIFAVELFASLDKMKSQRSARVHAVIFAFYLLLLACSIALMDNAELYFVTLSALFSFPYIFFNWPTDPSELMIAPNKDEDGGFELD